MSRQALGRHGLLNVEACRRVWEEFILHGGSWSSADLEPADVPGMA